VGSAQVEVVPAKGQLPYCLVFTESEKGVLRQLTMNFEDQAVPCEAGAPIGGTTYKIPPREGKVRVYVVFADRPIKAANIAQRLNELHGEKKVLTAMDLRAPGQVAIDTLEYAP
jgi:hypothetical protein